MSADHATPIGPTTAQERFDMLDVVRGVAVLAILAVNMKVMAAPFQAYNNPGFWEGPWDRAIFLATTVLVEMKFITIFSTLFGAGLALVAARSDANGVRGRLRDRNLWLLIFGLAHGFLIWVGDVLAHYALAGAIAALFIRGSARTLFTAGAVLLLIGFALQFLALAAPPDAEVDQAMKAALWAYDGDLAQRTIAAYGGDILAQLRHRANEFPEAFAYALFLIPRTIGLMLIGGALYKTGFLTGAWPPGRYAAATVIGLVLGLAAELARVMTLEAMGWPFGAYKSWSPLVQYPASLAAAFGYAAAIGWALRSGVTLAPLAAAGRMAFTNYIASSLILTTIYNGHGLGIYGRPDLTLAGMITLGAWAAMLVWSPLWLARFRFGPLEWAWRSLTYRRMQPLRG